MTELLFLLLLLFSFAFSRNFIWWFAFPPEMIFYKLLVVRHKNPISSASSFVDIAR